MQGHVDTEIKKHGYIKDSFTHHEEESSLTSMSCDVVVVGGGISGMYMAETLVRMKKETNVCLFEKDSRFGGRDYDVGSAKHQTSP
ncbi:hypothetical protein OS493_013920 [Desmophyllum pertusum]|uniref:Uncharacterized protein n=1 Tax=Desmophyllum pertusum TaxID=174260 RepID=A0A9W9ZTV6_9CNID|nr:hypothetical protein OS493_013920 [Desmophyllum pertusum]